MYHVPPTITCRDGTVFKGHYDPLDIERYGRKIFHDGAYPPTIAQDRRLVLIIGAPMTNSLETAIDVTDDPDRFADTMSKYLAGILSRVQFYQVKLNMNKIRTIAELLKDHTRKDPCTFAGMRDTTQPGEEPILIIDKKRLIYPVREDCFQRCVHSFTHTSLEMEIRFLLTARLGTCFVQVS